MGFERISDQPWAKVALLSILCVTCGCETRERSRQRADPESKSEFEKLGCGTPSDSISCMEAWQAEKRREEMAKQLDDAGFFDEQ